MHLLWCLSWSTPSASSTSSGAREALGPPTAQHSSRSPNPPWHKRSTRVGRSTVLNGLFERLGNSCYTDGVGSKPQGKADHSDSPTFWLDGEATLFTHEVFFNFHFSESQGFGLHLC